MTDEALFHSLLCGSALVADIQMGRIQSPERSRHMEEACRLVSVRLRSTGSELSDGTLVTVAHLADFEVSPSFCLNLEC